MQIRALQAYTT